MPTIDGYIAQQAENLTDRILARLQNVRTPAQQAQALRSVLRKLGINDQVVAQVSGGVNLRRAMISGYGDYIRAHAGIGSGLSDDPKASGGSAADAVSNVVGIINQVVDAASAVGETVAGLWGAFGGGSEPPLPPPPPADPVKPARYAAAWMQDPAKRQSIIGMVRAGPNTQSGGTFGEGISLSNIPPMVLIGGAAAAAGLGYYLITSKKKGARK